MGRILGPSLCLESWGGDSLFFGMVALGKMERKSMLLNGVV